MWDLRRLLSWLRADGATQIGVYGLSLGGYTTALLAGLDSGLACAIAGIPATDFSRLVARLAPHATLREIERLGLDWSFVRACSRSSRRCTSRRSSRSSACRSSAAPRITWSPRIRCATCGSRTTSACLGGKPCFFLWTEATGWGRMLAVCGCNLPQVKVKEILIGS